MNIFAFQKKASNSISTFAPKSMQKNSMQFVLVFDLSKPLEFNSFSIA